MPFLPLLCLLFVQVFTGCAPEVGTNCQLCLSVIKDQILNRASMTCTLLGVHFIVAAGWFSLSPSSLPSIVVLGANLDGCNQAVCASGVRSCVLPPPPVLHARAQASPWVSRVLRL